MAFLDFLSRAMGRPVKLDRKTVPRKIEKKKGEVLTLQRMMKELGIQREGVIGSYDTEENPDDLGPSTYISMQGNDGEVQAIVRILTLPVISTQVNIIPHPEDSGERDFIDTVFNKPPYMGGMTTPLSFLVADMTRAIFEGYRLYEKVARIIDKGKYKGKIGWRKLSPRDARTISLRSDRHGGFKGAYQRATFGNDSVTAVIPPEKCMLFTFQKEKHWLYGESILKSAYYHYDKKHKLYYISHKKAEVDALGLKILKIGQNLTEAQREAAENVVDRLGINSRITLPSGVELEIVRGGESGYNPMPLIEHHNAQMAKSALAQVLNQVKYAYPYGTKETPSDFLVLAVQSILKQMEETLNIYAVAPLIDYNFGTQAYPEVRFNKISGNAEAFLKDVFLKLIGENTIPIGFVEKVVEKAANSLRLEWKPPEENEEGVSKKALESFEMGKLKKANELSIPAPKTMPQIKDKLLGIREGKDTEEKYFKLGEDYSQLHVR